MWRLGESLCHPNPGRHLSLTLPWRGVGLCQNSVLRNGGRVVWEGKGRAVSPTTGAGQRRWALVPGALAATTVCLLGMVAFAIGAGSGSLFYPAAHIRHLPDAGLNGDGSPRPAHIARAGTRIRPEVERRSPVRIPGWTWRSRAPRRGLAATIGTSRGTTAPARRRRWPSLRSAVAATIANRRTRWESVPDTPGRRRLTMASRSTVPTATLCLTTVGGARPTTTGPVGPNA